MAEVNWWLTAVGVYLVIVGSLGSTLNFLVLIMYQRFKSLGSPTFLLLTNLALCDLGLIMSNTPFAASASLNNKWPFGEKFCQFYAFSGMLFGSVHIFSLMLLAIDRYRTTCQTNLLYCQETEEETVRTYRRRLIFIWIYALFWALVPLFGWTSYGLDLTTQTCTIAWWENGIYYKTFIVTFAGLGFLIPAVIIIVCYWKATRKLREKFANNESDPLTSYWDNIKDVTFMTILINLAFFLAWTPIVVLCFWTVFADPTTVPHFMKASPTLFVKTAPLLDPLIYFFSNTKLRSALFAVIRCQNARQLSDSLQRRSSKSHELDVMNHELDVVDHELGVMNHELGVMVHATTSLPDSPLSHECKVDL